MGQVRGRGAVGRAGVTGHTGVRTTRRM
jgi:hypothetical protein